MEPGSKPKLKDINRIVKPFAFSKWYDIGLELGVGDEEGELLDGIKSSCGNDKEECFTEMMKVWVRSSTPAVTWKTLLSCLKELGLQEAVESTESKLQLPDHNDRTAAPEAAIESMPSDDSPQSVDDIQKSLSHENQLSRVHFPAEEVGVRMYKRAPETLPLSVNPPQVASIEFLPGPKVQESDAELSNSLPANYSDSLPDSPQPISYSIRLPPGYEIRNYQKELAEPGIRGDNYIFVAPTGSGKTLVAAMVICEHLNKVQALGEVPKVIFIVTTKPLAEQQQRSLQQYIQGARVEWVVGQTNASIKNMLTLCEIVVTTAGKLLDELNQEWVTLTPSYQKDESQHSISLLVMDECHHARKTSIHAQVMHVYLQQKSEAPPESKFPQVVGITASPGAGDNPNLDITKTIDHLVNLCAILDATGGIVTVQENVKELERYTNNPTLSREEIVTRNYDEPFIALIESEMVKLESITKLEYRHFPRWSKQYEITVKQAKLPFELSTNENFRDQISTLKLLICYCKALNIYMDLRQEDALIVLDDHDDLPDNDEICTKQEKYLKTCLSQLKANLKALPCIENPLLKRAEEAMEAFREGKSNILVATSVAEEGIDVPACNFVIRFLHVSTEIAKVQSQGRARAEDSEVITILSSESALNMREIRNTERLDLVSKITQQNWFPTKKEVLQQKLQEQQDLIIQDLKFKQLYKQHQNSVQRDKIKLICRKCKTRACYGSDIFTTGEGTHYVVPGKEIMDKVIKKTHKKPGRVNDIFSKTHKIFCKKCDADWPWGVMCVWLKDQFEFPVLKCASFTLQEGEGSPFQITQWSKAPFKPLPLEVWIAGQVQENSEPEEED